jgi:hypothetical protein
MSHFVKIVTLRHRSTRIMWQVIVFKIVMAGLKALAKSSDNKIDDAIIKVVDDAATLKTIKSLL